jgi:hypothetical protein
MRDARRVAQGSTGARGRLAAVISSDDRPREALSCGANGLLRNEDRSRSRWGGGEVTVRHTPRPTPVSGDRHSKRCPWPGQRQDVLWCFDGLAARVRYPGTTETLAAGLRRLRLRRSMMHPLRGSGYFAEFVRGLGLHTFDLSGGQARSSRRAALRIDCDRLKGMF